VRTIKLSQASRPLAEYAADLHGEIVVLTERNRPVAAIVPLKRSDQESVALSGHPEFLALIARSRSEFQRGHTLSLAEMKKAFSQGRSPHQRLQPTKARRRSGTKRGAHARLRG
jgi:antitoxin (DNA-binding transcriptional repressor) of toxin-antitoxin stability system